MLGLEPVACAKHCIRRTRKYEKCNTRDFYSFIQHSIVLLDMQRCSINPTKSVSEYSLGNNSHFPLLGVAIY